MDQRARTTRTGGLHHSGANSGALYLRWVGEGVRHEAEHRFLDVSKIHVGPVELKRLRFTPPDLTSDQSSVVLGHLNLSYSGDNVRPSSTMGLYPPLETTGDNHRQACGRGQMPPGKGTELQSIAV